MQKDLTVQKFTEYLSNGMYTFPGGYPMYFITRDGGALSFDAAEEQKAQIVDAMNEGGQKQWEVIAVDINWDNADLYCEHTGEPIPSAYAD